MALENRRDLLPGAEVHTPAGKRKPEAEETGSRFEPRQSDAAGRAGKRTDAGTAGRMNRSGNCRASKRQNCFAVHVSRDSSVTRKRWRGCPGSMLVTLSLLNPVSFHK